MRRIAICLVFLTLCADDTLAADEPESRLLPIIKNEDNAAAKPITITPQNIYRVAGIYQGTYTMEQVTGAPIRFDIDIRIFLSSPLNAEGRDKALRQLDYLDADHSNIIKTPEGERVYLGRFSVSNRPPMGRNLPPTASWNSMFAIKDGNLVSQMDQGPRVFKVEEVELGRWRLNTRYFANKFDWGPAPRALDIDVTVTR